MVERWARFQQTALEHWVTYIVVLNPNFRTAAAEMQGAQWDRLSMKRDYVLAVLVLGECKRAKSCCGQNMAYGTPAMPISRRSPQTALRLFRIQLRWSTSFALGAAERPCVDTPAGMYAAHVTLNTNRRSSGLELDGAIDMDIMMLFFVDVAHGWSQIGWPFT